MSSSRRHTVPRQLYDLPQRKLEKIDRKLQHDGYNVGGANKLKMAIEQQTQQTTKMEKMEKLATVAADLASSLLSKQQSEQQLIRSVPMVKQYKTQEVYSNALVERETTATTATATTAVIVSHTAEQIASLPLLAPFKIKNPNESTIVNTIINEQHAYDSMLAYVQREEELRSELQKVKSGNNEDSNKDGEKNNKDADGSSNKALVTTSNSNNNNNAKGGKKKRKQQKLKELESNIDTTKVKELESQIDLISLAVNQQRVNLEQFANWTKAMLQAEYSKLVITLDPESKRYNDLDESIEFLCPRLNKHNNGGSGNGNEISNLFTNDGTEEYFHEQRLTYVKELIPVIQKVGTKSTIEDLDVLPYLQKFQCTSSSSSVGDSGAAGQSSPIITALIDEMYQLQITEGVRSRIGKEPTKAEYKVLKHVEEMLDRKEIVTSELVRKHYRKRSIKLHPDRNGEEMRPVFEEFTDARTVLSDIKLRQSYLRGMLDVVKLSKEKFADHSAEMISNSHDAWNQKHRPDKADTSDDPRRKSTKKDGKKKTDDPGKPLKLEGGLYHQIPRGVMLHHRRDGKKSHVVGVSIRVLRPIHDFYARVRSIQVELKDTFDTKHVMKMTRAEIVEKIKYDIERHGPILDSEISVGEITLTPGNWEVFWYATLDTVQTDPINPQNATGQSVTTCPSASCSFLVVDYEQQRKIQDFDLAEQACKVIRGELSNTLHKLRTNQQDSSVAMSTSARFGHYHQVLVRARKKCANLHRLMTLTGKSSAAHDSLSSLLAESRLVFAELEKQADAAKKREVKKDDVKRFKAYIASVLESDDPVGWMTSIAEAQLYREGGDVNRLYQLFIEGKGQYTLLIDSEMYKEAALRDDIFSKKQCKDLAQRGEEVADAEAREEEEAAAEEERRKLEEEKFEKMTKEAELRAKWAFVGQNTTIHGLTSEKGKHMNGQFARVMYYSAEKDRFEVQLYTSEDKAYLKRDNLTVYYGHVPLPPKPKPQQQQPKVVKAARPTTPPPTTTPLPQTDPAASDDNWQCKKCTFDNESADASCSMCTTPRPTKQPKQKAAVVEIKNEVKPVLLSSETFETTKTNGSDSVKMKKTIYIRSSFSKKLTGKRGRKKKEFVTKSGVDDIQIETSAIGNHVPVHLMGSNETISKAISLIEEAIGEENVSDKNPAQPKPTPPKPSSPAFCEASPAVSVSPPTVKAPAVAPEPIAPPVGKNSIPPVPPKEQSLSGIFSGFNKTINGINNHASVSGSETQPGTSQYSFGDALLPRGLMDMSLSVPATALPGEVPSEIGINSQGMTRETITEASISSLNGSNDASKTYSNFTLNENDSLLVFLRSQHQCIKGSVDEFYIWLVKSEDIDSMLALKEAVSDDDYLNDTMKVGNGTSGLKGFKRKAFHRAVMEYSDDTKDTKSAEDVHHQVSQKATSTNGSSSMHEMNGNAFLPSNLFTSPSKETTSNIFSAFNEPKRPIPSVTNNLSDPPTELVCPIGLVLMTNDPVLASDGVTYERASIEDWFQKSMSKLRNARENLKWNPHSVPDQRIIRNGICSPVHGSMMRSLALSPNTSIRNMARAYKEKREQAARF